MSWRDGVHVAGTAIWCDARRARGVCFASSADAVTRAGHGQIIASRETLALLGVARDAQLAAPPGRPFTLGTVRLELVPSGHGRGGAALAVDTGDRRVFYAGAHNPAGGGLGAPGELRPCDTLVVVAPWGEPGVHEWPAPAEQTRALIAACDARRGSDAAVVVLVDTVVDGLEVAALLERAGVAVSAHRAIIDAARRLRAADLDAPALRRTIARGRVLVWPLGDRARLAATLRELPAAVIVASGRAREPGVVDAIAAATARTVEAVPWSLAGDRNAMLALAASSGARELVLLGAGAEPLAAAIGHRARVLGPPRQMPLFAALS